MKRTITGFHQDAVQDWVAELDCHHQQHVRHTPPFRNRPWVESQAGRDARLGTSLDCPLCDRLEMPANLAPYKRTPDFFEHSIPRGLLKNHATKRGVWGKINVIAGELEYTVEDPPQMTIVVSAGQSANIPPERLHRVAALDAVHFFVEFYQPAASDQNMREHST